MGRRRGRSHTARLLATVGLVAFIVAIVVSVSLGLDRGGNATTEETTTTTTTTSKPKPKPPPPPPPAKPTRVPLAGVAAYDPFGDRAENDSLVSAAVDGDASTFWKSENYHATFYKKGIGVILDLGRTVGLTRVQLVTDTPGFTAEIQTAKAPSGPWATHSPSRTVNGVTTLPVVAGVRTRYLLVWITAFASGQHEVHLDEVRAWAG